MKAALVLVVKSPTGNNFDKFRSELKDKLSQAPFFSDYYNRTNTRGQMVRFSSRTTNVVSLMQNKVNKCFHREMQYTDWLIYLFVA